MKRASVWQRIKNAVSSPHPIQKAAAKAGPTTGCILMGDNPKAEQGQVQIDREAGS